MVGEERHSVAGSYAIRFSIRYDPANDRVEAFVGQIYKVAEQTIRLRCIFCREQRQHVGHAGFYCPIILPLR
jgi:hypothetical protein